MKFFRFLIIFIFLTTSIKADINENLINNIKKEGSLIFIRHAYAPGSGDPNNFELNDCDTQRNLNDKGINQAKKIGIILKKLGIDNKNVYSSEWCRCQDTAKLAFGEYKNLHFSKSFQNPVFSVPIQVRISDTTDC